MEVNNETLQLVAVVAILILCVAWILYRMFARRRKSNTDCDCGCSGCSLYEHCNKQSKQDRG